MRSAPVNRAHTARLVALLCILLGQFYLRIHNILEMPIYVDEIRHIERAAIVYKFDVNPLALSHGKLLTYYWIGLFSPQLTLNGLFVARASVALISLVTGAALAAIARDLFGRRAMIPVVALYAVIPHALFFERMALADPVAAAFGTLAVWLCIGLVRCPTPLRGVLTALLVTAAILAKCTVIGLTGLPVGTWLILRRAQASHTAARPWRAALSRLEERPRLALLALLGTTGVLGMVIVLAIGLSVLFAPTINLMDISPGKPSSVADQRDQLAEILHLLLSWPLMVGLIVAIAVLWRWRSRATLVVLAWLVVLWLPIIVLSGTQRGRYLMVGVPAVACLAGAGMIRLADAVGARTAGRARIAQAIGTAIVIVVVGGWAVLYGLPFAATAAMEPDQLRLPALDMQNYLYGPSSAWGVREALAYLDIAGDRADDGFVPAFGVLWVCGLADPYRAMDLAWGCHSYHAQGADYAEDGDYEWEFMLQHVGRSDMPFLYVLDDDPRERHLDPRPTWGWELADCFALHGIQRPVCVWRVEAESPAS